MKIETKYLDFFQMKEELKKLQPIFSINTNQVSRHSIELNDFQLVIDTFDNILNPIYSFRFSKANKAIDRKIILNACYDIKSCAAGGWLLLPKSSGSVLWVPKHPTLRQLDDNGHILNELEPELQGIDISNDVFSITLKHIDNYVLDIIIVEFASDSTFFVNELSSFRSFELNSVFLWGSHTKYTKPSDFFLHFIHGHIYENRISWPFFYKICSENDAHALFVTLSGLEQNTGKKIYWYLKNLLVLSVISRQSEEGAWRHGEWSKNNESHFRLHTSAIHLLRDYWSETKDDSVLPYLRKGIEFLIQNSSRVNNEVWFLHDELETTVDRLNKSPFKWKSSDKLGQSSANMLVLNTHLDTTVAIQCYSQLLNENKYNDVIKSANQTTSSILLSKKYTLLYRLIDSIIFLTLLPTNKAKTLPIYSRMIKRLGWKYLSPNLYKIKAVFPRIVMPNGFIERALTIRGLADEYLSINMMDLARSLRWDNVPEFKEIIDSAILLEQKACLREKWLENKNQKYSIGFYAEAMYHLCLLFNDWKYRKILAETLIMMSNNKMGLIPSILGGNKEAVENINNHIPNNMFNEKLIVSALSARNNEIIVLNVSSEKGKVFQSQEHESKKIVIEYVCALKSATQKNTEIPVSIEMELDSGDWMILKRVTS